MRAGREERGCWAGLEGLQEVPGTGPQVQGRVGQLGAAIPGPSPGDCTCAHLATPTGH